jgi:preprotein translocase subunit SecG
MDFLKQGGGSLDKLGGESREKFDSELGSDSNFVTTASHEKRIKNGTIIFIAVFCVSLVGLWFMVKKASPQSAIAKNNKEDMQIETAIAKITGTKAEFFKGIDNVLGKFNEFSNFAQVKVGELKKNPFEHQKIGEAAMEDPIASFAERQRAANSELEKGATGMQLLSIMKSPRGNSCMINDKILSKGDKIDGWQITSIKDGSVELTAGGMQRVLSISTD